MKCEWVRENITLHVYGELADDVRHELEQHVARCGDCAAELKAEQEFHAVLSQDRAAEPTPNLLAASRMRLQEALETAEQGHFWHRLAFDPANWLRQVRFSPALASVILILGFAGGVGTSYRVVAHQPQSPVTSARCLRSGFSSGVGGTFFSIFSAFSVGVTKVAIRSFSVPSSALAHLLLRTGKPELRTVFWLGR